MSDVNGDGKLDVSPLGESSFGLEVITEVGSSVGISCGKVGYSLGISDGDVGSSVGISVGNVDSTLEGFTL